MDLEGPISAEDTGEVSEKVLKHAHDADEAMKAFVGHEGEVIRLAEATNKRLLRKIDMNLMPVCGLKPFS
jgi:ACS family allantoate permease-like MFS transporter